MPEKDPEHWLYRLTPEEWLRAADNELAAARRAFLAKQQRAAVTYARRAAGMALNALLCIAPDDRYGRSYMDHLKAMSTDDGLGEELRTAALRLLSMPLVQQLVTLGSRGDAGQAEPAARIIAYVRGVIAPQGRA